MPMIFKNVFGSNHGETTKVAGSEKFAITRKPTKKKAAAAEVKPVEAKQPPKAAAPPARKPRAVVRSAYLSRGEDE